MPKSTRNSSNRFFGLIKTRLSIGPQMVFTQTIRIKMKFILRI